MSLPNDIWLHIAAFVSPLAMQSLYTVNSVFFNVAMEQRYQQVSFSYLTRKMIWILARLKDPAVAKRVRILHLYPHFVKEALDKENAPASQASLMSKFGELAAHIRDQKLFGKHKPARLPFKIKTCDDLIQVMIDVLSSLPNLTDYHIAWCGLPSVSDIPVPIMMSVLQPNIRRLWLEISLEKLQYLPSNPFRSLELEELDLFIRVDHDLSPDRYAAILYSLAQTINLLRSSLRKLRIQLWEPLDLAPFFGALEHFPSLEKLSLSIPISAPHLGDPESLIDFLSLHSHTLQHLSVRATELSGRGLTPVDTPLGEWMDTIFANVRLGLTSLDISLNLIPFESALLAVRKFAGTLTSLVFTGCHLTLEEIAKVTDAFPLWWRSTCHETQDVQHNRRRRGLEFLRLGSVTLSPQLVDLLAEQLPRLEKLELLVREVVPCEGDLPLYYSHHNSDRDQDEGQLSRFFDEMEKRFYPDWRLAHLDISRSSFPFQLQYGMQYRELFVQCVPSIRTFVVMGSMRY